MGKKAHERKAVTVQPRKAAHPQSSRSPQNRTKAVVISELIEQPREGQLPPFLDAILQPSPPAELSVSLPEHQGEQTAVESSAEPDETPKDREIVCCARGDIADYPRRWGYRNVFGLSIAFVVVFCAFIGLQNLQSSINAEGGLGLASLSVLYAVFFLSGFVTPGIVRLLGTKYCLLFGFVCHLIYSLANYHPTWYTLIPSSVAFGFASAPVWVAATTHITEVAVTIAPALKKDQNRLISMFVGIFYFFFHFSQIPGNLASSLILFPYGQQDDQPNASNVSSAPSEITAYLDEEAPPSDDVCNVLEVTSIDRTFYNILVSAYVFFVVTGIAILLLTVDRLQTDAHLFSAGRKFELFLKRPLLDLLKVLKDVRMIMIAPMAMFSGLEQSFVFGAFTEAYISECFGTYQVGFTLLCLGITSAVMSYVYGKLAKYVPRFSVVVFGACINIVLILFLFLWERKPSYPVIFTFAVGWGAASAVWHTMSASLTGILFSDRSENAYSALRIWQASGFTMGFASAKLLTIEGQLWILLGTVVLAAVFNLLVELNTQTKDQLMPCCSRSSRKGNFPTTSTPHNIKPDVHISDPPKSPSCSNILFTAYDGRRPSGWNVACDSSQGLPFNPAFALTDAILEEDRENDRGYSVAPQKRNSINPSRSYHQAMVHRANMEGLEDVDLSEVVVEGPSLLSPHRRESINPAVSYIEALQHAGIDD